ncbi:hypothetical protein Agub_g9344 [Astrephomene gubernaculifera]|uniref:MYND-type domain-containing protein n=1 Tax=Astrephomene gubernaculifera TaxID=47775 RepID=A0AAD3DTJ6_9CHLO|nr:hypothetical protein Agub_g9344 [Astrephomene gubernaculifera]
MSEITMDPPHLVHTGAACYACCTVAPGKLLRCSACDSAWYCDINCQRKHFKEHKPYCRALRLFHALQADLPPESWPRNARDFYVQRSNCHQILEPMLRRPLTRAEHRAILGEARCSVCMVTRGQLARRSKAAAAAATASSASSSKAAAAAAEASAPPSTAVNGNTGNSSSANINGSGLLETEQQQQPATAAAASSTETQHQTTGTQPNAASSNAAAAAPPADKATAADTAASTPTPRSSAPALTCCPHCHWGWACPQHRDAYLAGPHAAVCTAYQNMNESQLLTHRYLTATGRLPNYVPDKMRPTGQSASSAAAGATSLAGQAGAGGWEPVPAAGWAAFQAWRPLPVFDAGMMCLLTKRMSQALTVVQALQHHYPPAHLASLRHLELHVLGASAFEVPADRIWEELLNLLPPPSPPAVPARPQRDSTAAAAAAAEASAAPSTATSSGPPRVLHVAFVGPELRDIILEDSDGRALPQGSALSSPPPPPGREMLYSYHLCTYQEFAAGRRPHRSGGSSSSAEASLGRECPWRKPDLAIAFNSGMSESDKQLWAPALEVLVRQGVPVVFTSYNGEEAAADAAAWRAAGGRVTLGPERNPYRALEPISEPSGVDEFYYQNYYWWCGRAAATVAAAGK